MIDCVAVGDSIALGTGIATHCKVQAHIGWPSSKIIQLADGTHARLCIVSSGSNDPYSPSLRNDLEATRSRLGCPLVVWVLPVNKQASATVLEVSRAHSDHTVSFTPGGDHIHPKNYQEVVKSIANLGLH